MANHKSALKRNKQSQLARLRNRMNKTRVKSVVKKISEAIAAQSVEGAQQALKEAIPVIDRAATKGTLHRNNASRKVSRLTTKVNDFVNAMQAAS